MKVAILDLGTNTFHLLIAEVDQSGSWHKIFKERVTVKLGKKGIDKKIIAIPAYRRGMKALEQFNKSIRQCHVKKIYAFGTAALRSSSNGKQFLKEAKSRFNINISLITGDQEALFIYYGVRQAIKLGAEKSLIMDIGGGSMELLIANESKIFWKHSFKLGAALLLGKFTPNDPLTKQDIKILYNHFHEVLRPAIDMCNLHKPVELVGSAGSFETLASMIRHRFPGAGSHYGKTSHPISLKHFKAIHRSLLISDEKARNRMKGLIKMRIDMIVMASLLLNFVLDQTKIKSIQLSAYALKEGALWKTIQSKPLKSL